MGRQRKYLTSEEAKEALKQQKKRYTTEKYLDILKERRRKEREAKLTIYIMFKEGELYGYDGFPLTMSNLPNQRIDTKSM